MTDEIDINEMASDVFEQSHPKKKVNDLRDLDQYKNDYVGDEDFNSAVITPQDITVTDLFPDEFDVKTKKEMINEGMPTTRGYYRPKENNIVMREDALTSDLIHENIHKRVYRQFKSPSVLLEYGFPKNIPINKPQINRANVFKSATHTKQIKNDINYLTNQDAEVILNENNWTMTPLVKRSIKSQKNENIVNIINPIGYTGPHQEFTIDEDMARFGAKWPNEIINPKTKTGKRLNRIWFQ